MIGNARRLVTAAMVCHSVFEFASAGGQCEPGWAMREHSGIPGVDRSVYALGTWDPDEDGPLPELLIAGGNFTFAGTTPAANIAAWDGERWTTLGSGVDAP